MPDKKYVKGCGKSCYRCWVNRLNHGSKLKKKNFPKHFNNEPTKEIYLTNIEEFVDKYIESIYTEDRMNEIDNETNVDDNIIQDSKYYNDCLISKTATSYNNWLLSEKGIKKKVKDKDIIKLMKSVDGSYIGDRILSSKTMKYNDFYMFDCTY